MAPGPALCAPLWAVCSLTLIGSFGTGLITNGIGFLAQSALGYGDLGSYGLHLAMGVSYIGGALGVSRGLRWLAARSARVSTRRVIACLLVGIGLVCLLPLVSAAGSGRPGAWSLWVMVVVFAPLTGAMWPIVESYLSGGRRGRGLRHAVGGFNIIWASAVAVAFWISAPLVEPRPLTLIAILGLLHVVAIPLLLPMGREPARHLDDQPHVVDPIDVRLLRVCRVLLPTSYLILTSLLPFMPETIAALEIDPVWALPIVSAWTITRVITFAVMQRWHGWRHAASAPVIGAGLMLAGFAASIMTRAVAPGLTASVGGWAPIALLVGGLLVFGVGLAIIYAASLYYAMEVGAAEVDAGGKHEALIGLGYTAGPLIGLIALLIDRAFGDQTKSDSMVEWLLIGAVSLIAIGATGVAFRLSGSPDPATPPAN